MPAFYAHERFGKKVWKQMHGLDCKVLTFFSFIDYTVIMKFQNMERICTRFLHIRSFRKQ